MNEQVMEKVKEAGKSVAIAAVSVLGATAKKTAEVAVKGGMDIVKAVGPKVAEYGADAAKKVGGATVAAVAAARPVLKKLAPLNKALFVISATMTALTVAGYFITRDKKD